MARGYKNNLLIELNIKCSNSIRIRIIILALILLFMGSTYTFGQKTTLDSSVLKNHKLLLLKLLRILYN